MKGCRIGTIVLVALAAGFAAAGAQGRIDPAPASTEVREIPALDRKIGRMVLMGFSGTSPGDPFVVDTIRRIREGTLGGVIFYSCNVVDPVQTRSLTAAFAEAARGDLPLPVAVDQEGGLVQRLTAAKGFAGTPSAEAVTASYPPGEAYGVYHAMASMLRDTGFTWNFGPVVDLRGDPDDPAKRPASPVIGGLGRSYSDDPETVVAYASAFIKAHRDSGVATALKHFPGHGLAGGDSHLGLVDITETARPEERIPFARLIREGMADAVMTAHLVDRRVDADNPLTLSPGFMDLALREACGFQGPVVTDDLHMGAIQLYHSFGETVVKAILAGDDILVFSNNPAAARNVPGFAPDHAIAEKVIAVVKDAIARGVLTESRIDESVRRIDALRARMKR